MLCTVIVTHEFVQYVDLYLPLAVPESLSNSKADARMTTAEATSKLSRLPCNSGYLNLIREQKAEARKPYDEAIKKWHAEKPEQKRKAARPPYL